MTRVKKGVNALKTRRNVLKMAKGYRFSRSKKERNAYEAVMKAGYYAFAHRRDKKNDRRQLAIVRINAVLHSMNLSYSKVIGQMKKKNILIDRKSLADLALNNPEIFKKIIAEATK